MLTERVGDSIRNLLMPPIGWLLLGVLQLSACTDRTSLTPTTPTPSAATACQPLAASAPVVVNAAGGTGSVAVMTAPGCRWTAVVRAGAESWLHVDNEDRSVGPGSVWFTIQANRAYSSRSGSFVALDDQGYVLATYEVMQRAATCLYSVDPSALSLPNTGTYDGAGDTPIRVSVHTEPADCQWNATASAPWIRVYAAAGYSQTEASGTGDGAIYLSVVGWNWASEAKVGDVVVRGLSGVNPDARLTVTQSGYRR